MKFGGKKLFRAGCKMCTPLLIIAAIVIVVKLFGVF